MRSPGDVPPSLSVTVRLLSAMASSHKAEITLPNGSPLTVAAALEGLVLRIPNLRSRIFCAPGVLLPGVNVFVGDENVRFLDGLETAIAPDEEVWIITPESGG